MLNGSDSDWLSGVAMEARGHTQWHEFSAFAENRSQGLRTAALRHLSQFIRVANEWAFEERLEFCRWLLGKGGMFGLPDIASPQPLHAHLLVPTFKAWLERDPMNAEAHLWLGLLGCDDPSEHLDHVLVLDPGCEQAKRVLAQWIIADVCYNQHHFPELYIHDPRDDLVQLDRAADLVTAAPASDEAANQMLEIIELRRNAEAWLAAHPTPGDFAIY